MKVVLELLQQSSNIKRVTVRHDIVIGRGSDCNLRVSAPQVSRRHCFLRIDGNTVAVTDLESCNGTWLDGQKTVPGKRYFLKDGMQLAVGPVRFVTRISGIEEEIAQPSPQEAATADLETAEPVSALADSARRMDFSIERAGASAEQDEPTVDYQGSESDSAIVELDEIEIIDDLEIVQNPAQSAEVILMDDATDVIDREIVVEEVELVEAAEIIDEDIDSQELMLAEEVVDEDSGEALRDFLQDND